MSDGEDVSETSLERIRTIGWHETKRANNLWLHKIDFEDAKNVFDSSCLVRRSEHGGEVRHHIIGIIDGQEIAIACSLHNDLCWIISARRARPTERQEYHHHVGG